MKIKAIVTGATGMVGEGVLHVCLEDPAVENVLVIGRRTCGVTHPKLKEHLRDDFYDFSDISGLLSEYNACFFCLGISSVGVDKDKYFKITHDITLALARSMATQSPDSAFCYVSGAGTDSSEQGRLHWARVKGQTENAIIRLFDRGYAFRPGYIQPMEGMKNTYKVYRVLSPFYGLWKLLMPGSACRLEHIGMAMIRCCTDPPAKHVLEGKDITHLANAHLEA